MSSSVEIANHALQLVGAARIQALIDNSKSARSVNTAYDRCRRAELRRHTWSCATRRASLATSATAPPFGRANQYPLPSDFVRLLPPDPGSNLFSYGDGTPLIFSSTSASPDRDWQIENDGNGNKVIVTNTGAPLFIRYVFDLQDPNQMDDLLRDALAARIALEIVEELTQSNEKKDFAMTFYKDVIAEAKQTNAVERVPSVPVLDPWLAARL